MSVSQPGTIGVDIALLSYVRTALSCGCVSVPRVEHQEAQCD